MAKAVNRSNHDNRDMKRLKDEQQVRQRAGVIFGTNDEMGAAHGVEEVVANSVDEAREGFGKEIRMTFEEDGTVDIEDDGRGLPMDWNEAEEMYNWELALCTLYASGKYDSSQYGNSTGLNGLGLTATQYASEFMDVWSYHMSRAEELLAQVLKKEKDECKACKVILWVLAFIGNIIVAGVLGTLLAAAYSKIGAKSSSLSKED